MVLGDTTSSGGVQGSNTSTRKLLGLHVCGGLQEAFVAICMGVTRDIHEWIDRRNTLTFGDGQVLRQ